VSIYAVPWWWEGRTAELAAMALHARHELIERDWQLAPYAEAARLRG